MHRLRFTAGIVLVGLVVTACTENSTDTTGQEPTIETATTSATEESSDAKPKESPTDSAAKEEEPTRPVPPNVVMDDEQPSPEADTASSCGAADAQTAFSEGVSQVAPWGTIGWELFDSTGYDPCASLSWETLMIEGGTSSSPFHIMLFNHGEYLGTATAKPYGFAPTIERVSDSEIAVTYHWPREGEGNANRSGTTDAGFRWDEGQQKVIMSGDVPPTG
ncbi:LppP/LprE family lipoprotein [Corynebacterium tuberculostearicum]|uniref:LppP/LprE family lipoprotein n=1 Tax=Corynebacterium tuberculostearicum TaxID=38304 RepID=UPI001243310F|nr:LppP/LprE family lipoprotein [Corynebacterium tuberculostearicum]